MRTVTIKDPFFSSPPGVGDFQTIDATVTINGGPEWPYTFAPTDYSGLGAYYYPQILAGDFGPVGPYVPPANE